MIKQVMFVPYCTQFGGLGMWPISIDFDDNSWIKSALHICSEALIVGSPPAASRSRGSTASNTRLRTSASHPGPPISPRSACSALAFRDNDMILDRDHEALCAARGLRLRALDVGSTPFREELVIDFEYDQSADGGLPDPLCRSLQLEDRRADHALARQGPRGRAPTIRAPGPCSSRTPRTPSACVTWSSVGRCRATSSAPTPRRERPERLGRRQGGLARGLAVCGIATITAADKDYGRSIAMRGRAYAEHHRDELLRYCESDVETNGELFLALLPGILEREHGLAHAIGRGWYMRAIASVEHAGIPFRRRPARPSTGALGEIRLELIATLGTGQDRLFCR